MAECPNKEKNLNNCTCTYTSCGKQGVCCECIAFHKSAGELPGCLFTAAAEKTYDRSIANFCSSCK